MADLLIHCQNSTRPFLSWNQRINTEVKSSTQAITIFFNFHFKLNVGFFLFFITRRWPFWGRHSPGAISAFRLLFPHSFGTYPYRKRIITILCRGNTGELWEIFAKLNAASAELLWKKNRTLDRFFFYTMNKCIPNKIQWVKLTLRYVFRALHTSRRLYAFKKNIPIYKHNFH